LLLLIVNNVVNIVNLTILSSVLLVDVGLSVSVCVR